MTKQKSIHVWVFQQLAKLHQEKPDLVDEAITQLFENNPELRWSLIISAYQDRQISLSQVAQLLDLHTLELRDRFIELGISLDLDEDFDTDSIDFPPL